LWSAGWFPEKRRAFLKNNRGLPHLDRPRAWSDGRENRTTWPLSPALFWRQDSLWREEMCN
jgi:hypothetical protein